MYLHETMNQTRAKEPAIKRIGQMNNVTRTLSGKVSGVKRIGGVPAPQKGMK